MEVTTTLVLTRLIFVGSSPKSFCSSRSVVVLAISAAACLQSYPWGRRSAVLKFACAPDADVCKLVMGIVAIAAFKMNMVTVGVSA